MRERLGHERDSMKTVARNFGFEFHQGCTASNSVVLIGIFIWRLSTNKDIHVVVFNFERACILSCEFFQRNYKNPSLGVYFHLLSVILIKLDMMRPFDLLRDLGRAHRSSRCCRVASPHWLPLRYLFLWGGPPLPASASDVETRVETRVLAQSAPFGS